GLGVMRLRFVPHGSGLRYALGWAKLGVSAKTGTLPGPAKRSTARLPRHPGSGRAAAALDPDGSRGHDLDVTGRGRKRLRDEGAAPGPVVLWQGGRGRPHCD